MSDEIFAADPDALRGSGRRIQELRSRVERLAREINAIITDYPDAAGDGNFRKLFESKYVPYATSANEYMKQLAAAVENFGSGAGAAAAVFESADDDATTIAKRR